MYNYNDILPTRYIPDHDLEIGSKPCEEMPPGVELCHGSHDVGSGLAHISVDAKEHEVDSVIIGQQWSCGYAQCKCKVRLERNKSHIRYENQSSC